MDPSYMHEFNPNREGFCKSIIAGRHCGLRMDWVSHIRYEANKPELPFGEFEVFIDDASGRMDVISVEIHGVMCSPEEMRQFVEDAIREKLERL